MNRLSGLRRSLDASTRTGKAYGQLFDTLKAFDPGDDNIAREVWRQEVARLESLMDEMRRSSEAEAHDIAELERQP